MKWYSGVFIISQYMKRSIAKEFVILASKNAIDFFPFSDKPAFTTHPQNKTVREGDPVTLFCNATGNPRPSISWTIDGLPVNITVHSRISFTADNKQLTVKNVNRTDSHHKYRCLARNSIGIITSYAASLTVQCEYDSKILRVCIIHYFLYPPSSVDSGLTQRTLLTR